MAGVPSEAYFSPSTAPASSDYYTPTVEPVKPAPVKKLARVLVYSPSWCSGCQQFERSCAGSTEYAFEFYHEEPKFPAFVRETIANGQVWPAIHFEVAPKVWRVVYGITSYQGFKDHFAQCSKNPTSFNTAPAKPKAISRGLYYGTYRSVYDWPGDLRQHLMGSPHNMGSEVYSMSDGECISAHDQWHIAQDSGSRSRARGRGLLSRMFGRA